VAPALASPTYPLPAFIALNEPSSHPEVPEPRARLIAQARERTQIRLVIYLDRIWTDHSALEVQRRKNRENKIKQIGGAR